jgi:hypothetical protein
VQAKIAIFGRIVDLRTSTIVEDDLPKPETSAEHATSLPSYKIMRTLSGTPYHTSIPVSLTPSPPTRRLM